MDKRLLLDVQLGVHIQRDSYLPGDGSGAGRHRQPRGPGGRPAGPLAGRRPHPDLRAGHLGAGLGGRTACTEPGATCNVVRYFTGGPGGLIET